jgi:hypothetical protein
MSRGDLAMPMGPAEIVSSLKELCEAKGPQLNTGDIVAWIDKLGGFETDAELIAFAKKMKARQFARMLTFEDEETGLRVKRLWSIRDRETGRRAYRDICDLPPERRRTLIREYSQFLDQLRTVRRAMSDYVAGQEFFDFYVGEFEHQSAGSQD